MLFTDGIILSLHELHEHDNFVLEIASTESIELSSKLAIAQRAIGYELSSFLNNRETPIALGRVVVNDELRDLLAVHTLAAVYADAYNRHLNDRYAGRAKDFKLESERSFQRYLQNGVGITGAAIPRADKPVGNDLDGGLLQSGVYVVQVAWEHIGGTVGEKSEPTNVECTGGTLVILPINKPSQAAAWHVFIAVEDEAPMRQNELPISMDEAWTQAAELRRDLAGPSPSGPSYYVRQGTQLVRR